MVAQAKPETVQKVMGIVKKQLALSDDIALTPESKFSELGADSLDTVISRILPYMQSIYSHRGSLSRATLHQ